MFAQVPQGRMLIYLAVLGLVPALLVLMHIWQESSHLDTIQERIIQVHDSALLAATKQAANTAVIAHYQDADNFYLDKYVQKLQLLESEVESLQHFISDKSFAEDEEAAKRYEQLVGPANALLFNEGAVVRYPLFREVVETQARPVEVRLPDIEKILTLVEGLPLGNNTVPSKRPQLIVLEFRLDKKRVSEDNETFLMNMRLLKREYL